MEKKKGNTKGSVKVEGANDAGVDAGGRNLRAGTAETITLNSAVTNANGVIGAGSDATFLERVIDYGGIIDWYPGDTHFHTFTLTGPDTFAGPAGTYRNLLRLRSNGVITGYRVTDAAGNETRFSATGQVLSRTDRYGNAETYLYSGNRVMSKTAPNERTILTFSYYPSGRLQSITDSAGNARTFCYDANACLFEYFEPPTDEYPTGGRWAFDFSSGSPVPGLNGNLLRIEDPDGDEVASFTYDGSDRAVTETRGGQTWQYAYTINGGAKVTTVTDPRGAITVLTYQGNVVEPTQIEEFTNLDIRPGEAPSYLHRFAYDANFNMTLRVTPEGRRYEWTYDGSGNVTQIRTKEHDTPINDPTDKVWNFTWGANRQMLTSTDVNNDTISYTWDAGGRLTRIDYPMTSHHGEVQTPFETYGYNSYGQMTSYADRDGVEYRWTHYATGPHAGRVATMERGPVGNADTVSWTYDSFGDVATYTDSLANQVSMTWNANHQLKEFVGAGPGQPHTRFVYDGRGRITRFEREYLDETGIQNPQNPWIVREVDYDPADRVTEIRDEATLQDTIVRSYTYDLAGNLEMVFHADGSTTQYVYDERNLVYKVIAAPGTSVSGTEQWDYDGDRNVVRHVAENGAETTLTYDRCGRLVLVTDALGNTTELAYDPSGNITRASAFDSTQVRLRETQYFYDAANRRIEERRQLPGGTPQEAVTKFHYTPGNQVKRVVNPIGVQDDYTYDDKGRLATASLYNGREVHDYAHDGEDRLVEHLVTMTNDATQVDESYGRTYAYDTASRVVERREWDRLNPTQYRSRAFTYDSFGRLITRTDENGDTSRRTWADGGPLMEVARHVRDASGQIIATRTVGFSYLDCSLLASVTDDNGRTTQYSYDPRSHLTTIQYPNLSSRGYTYAYAGLVATETDPNGSVATNTYDQLGRLTNISVQRGAGVVGTTSETFAYDGVGRPLSAANNATTLEWTWDSLNRVVAERSGPNPIGAAGLTVGVAYDLADNPTSFTYPGMTTVAHVYGPAGEIQSTSRNSVTTATYQHLGMTHLAGRQYGNGTASTFGRDGYLRVVGVDHSGTGGSFANFAYAYRPNDTMLYAQQNHLGGIGDVYAYDRDQGIVAALRGVANPAAEVANPGSQAYVTRVDYGLDGVVNRSSVTVTPFGGTATVTNYTSNAMNQYTTIGATNRVHDSNGNLTDDGTYLYRYDYRDRLVDVVQKSTQTSVLLLAHDTGGRRYQATAGGTTTRHVSWGIDAIEDRTAAGSVLREYVRDTQDGRLLAMWNAAGASHWYHEDGVANVSKVTTAAGAVVEEYRYNEFGGHAVHNAAGTPIPATTIANQYRLQGRRFETAGPGMYDYMARAYDTTTGRFLQHDPAGVADNMNRYSAMDHNPLRFGDRSGRRIAVAAGSTPEFRRRLNNAMSRLRRTRDGQRLYNELRRSRDTITFQESAHGNSYSPGVDTVNFDPCDPTGGENIFGDRGRPSFVGLGHEMRHALDDISGVPMSRPSAASLGSAETNSTHSENLIRDQSGEPRRAYYDYRNRATGVVTRHPVHNNPPR